MALEITGIRRDGVYGDQWNFPTRVLTAYHLASGEGSANVANGARFTPTAGRMYWMGVENNWHLEIHDGVGFIIAHHAEDLVSNTRQMAPGIFQSEDDGTEGTFRYENNTGAGDRIGYTWRQVM